MVHRFALLLLSAHLAIAADAPCWRVFPGMRTGSAISRQIWERRRSYFSTSEKSSALLRDERKAGGFTIQDPVAGMPTAFTAT